MDSTGVKTLGDDRLDGASQRRRHFVRIPAMVVPRARAEFFIPHTILEVYEYWKPGMALHNRSIFENSTILRSVQPNSVVGSGCRVRGGSFASRFVSGSNRSGKICCKLRLEVLRACERVRFVSFVSLYLVCKLFLWIFTLFFLCSSLKCQ